MLTPLAFAILSTLFYIYEKNLIKNFIKKSSRAQISGLHVDNFCSFVHTVGIGRHHVSLSVNGINTKRASQQATSKRGPQNKLCLTALNMCYKLEESKNSKSLCVNRYKLQTFRLNPC